MKTKHDIITLETEFYLMESKKCGSHGIFYLHPKGISFKKKEHYSLFKKFMEMTKLDTRDIMVAYLAKFDDVNQSIRFKNKMSVINVIGKFFLETNMDWPSIYYQTDSSLNAEYKQPTCNDPKESLDKEFAKGLATISLLGSIAERGNATIPSDVMELLGTIDLNPDEIKKVAPLIVQSVRTPDSLFSFFKIESIAYSVAPHLAPHISAVEAGIKIKQEINLSQAFEEKLRPFSFKANEIDFNKSDGTHVSIDCSPAFIEWFSQIEQGKPVTLKNGFVLYKKSENSISFNKGVSTSGIVITNNDNHFSVCNNLIADAESDIENITALRQGRLKVALANLYNLASESMLESKKATTLCVSLP